VLAFTDYAFQRWQYEHSLRLSDGEMREELRNLQTDPQANAHRQSVQQALANSQLEQLVGSCDLVLVDDNSLAVALQCDPLTTSIPRVITKGQGVVAEKIMAAARAMGVLIEPQRQLAKAIFRESQSHQQISPNRFQALARSYHDARENRPPGT
jgi:flagellar biosynthetic protein FlhB